MHKIVPGILGRVGPIVVMDVAERRRRLGRRHHLAPSSAAGSPLEVARSLVAFHATDPATVFLSAAARLKRPEVTALEHALYVDRVLVRMLGMRRTMFVAPTDFAPVAQAGPELKTQILLAAGKRYAALQGISTRVLMQLSADGRIVRGRPRGSWISSQYRWSTVE